METIKAGVLEVNLEVIKTLLHLPEEVKFQKVRQSWEQEKSGVFEILVEAPNLHEIEPGQVYPIIRCIIHSDWCQTDEITHITNAEVRNY